MTLILPRDGFAQKLGTLYAAYTKCALIAKPKHDEPCTKPAARFSDLDEMLEQEQNYVQFATKLQELREGIQSYQMESALADQKPILTFIDNKFKELHAAIYFTPRREEVQHDLLRNLFSLEESLTLPPERILTLNGHGNHVIRNIQALRELMIPLPITYNTSEVFLNPRIDPIDSIATRYLQGLRDLYTYAQTHDKVIFKYDANACQDLIIEPKKAKKERKFHPMTYIF
jgi:hypothetical protein